MATIERDLLDLQAAALQPMILVTETASSRLVSMMREKELDGFGLRVFVAGGGCSGLQYGMAFEAQAREFDTVVDQNGVKLFDDPTSLMYLAGISLNMMSLGGLALPGIECSLFRDGLP
jgi:iron-sulfur cluster assembly accessory protein